MNLNNLMDIVKSLGPSTIASIGLLAGAVFSGVWLLVIKKKRKKNSDEEEEYQRELASEYREQWLKSQENDN